MTATQRLAKKLPPGLRRLLGTLRRRLRALPVRTRLQKQRLLADSSLEAWERELLSRVDSRIYFNDGMYTGDGAHYYRVGLSAIRCVDEALRRASLTDVRRILDLPSGGGRVLRFIALRFPKAKVTACDLQRGAVDFCARTFGSAPVYSAPDFDELSLGAPFELIWIGSLVTHLDRDSIAALLRFCQRQLTPGGLVVFTTHGDYVARRLPTRDFHYGLAEDQIPLLTGEYARGGFAFADYPDASGYGVSLTSPEWVRRQVRQIGGLQEVYFEARGWDRHQDVYGFVRRD